MNNYIKTVSLTYNSTNVKTSTILSYFFRMIGTYIQENVIDVSQNTYFPQNSCLNIFLISKPKDLEFLNQKCRNVKNKILVTDNKDLESSDILYYSLENRENKIKFLKDIVSFALDSIKKEDNRNEIKAGLEEIIENYIEHRIAEKLVIRKFKFSDSPLYEDAVTQMKKAIKTINSDFDNKNLFHLNYAQIYLAYELNALQMRNKKRGTYNSGEIVSLTDYLLKSFPNEESLYLLKGTTLEELQSMPSDGFQEYKKALKINSNHPYALFRTGLYYQNYLRLPELAFERYKKLIELSPFSSKELYIWGQYHMMETMENDENTMEVMNAVPQILENKWSEQESPILLSPREIYFLFGAYYRMGRLYPYLKKKESNLYQQNACYCYQNALNIYKYYIDENRFIQTVFEEDCSSAVNAIIRENIQEGFPSCLSKIKEFMDGWEYTFEKYEISRTNQKIVKIRTR